LVSNLFPRLVGVWVVEVAKLDNLRRMHTALGYVMAMPTQHPLLLLLSSYSKELSFVRFSKALELFCTLLEFLLCLWDLLLEGV